MSQTKEGENRKIIILPDECLKNFPDEETVLEVLTLKHPFTETGSRFFLNESGAEIFELSVEKEKYSSWFVGETVQKDGSLHICSRFDPLYLILPYLKAASSNGKFVLLDQILKDDDFPDCARLVKCCTSSQISNIADSSGSGDFVGFRYNHAKVMSWLTKKVKAVKEAVGKSGVFVVPSDEDDKENEDVHLEYGCGILSNYLPEDVSDSLRKHLKIRKKPEKRASQDKSHLLSAKKLKRDLNAAEKPNKSKMTKAQRELSKVNTKGMKSISSFFTPKVKK